MCNGILCCFNLHLPDDIGYENLFIWIFSICISYLMRYLLRSLDYFFKNQVAFLLLNFRSSLNICVTILYQMCLLQIFSPSLWPVFSFSWYCLSQTFLILIKFTLLVLSFIDCVFVIVSKKALWCPKWSRFSFLLSSRSFIVFHFILRFVINIELIFMKGVMSVSRYLVFACGCPIVPASFLKETIFAPCVTFSHFSKISWLYFGGYISETSILLHWSICLFF